jgi:hypothetical protein
MESETEYWRRNRETFLAKEGLPDVVTLSSILREEGTRYEGVVEELVGISIGHGWRPVYIRIMWFFRPIEGSCAQACDWEKRMISEDDYQALLVAPSTLGRSRSRRPATGRGRGSLRCNARPHSTGPIPRRRKIRLRMVAWRLR